MTDNKKTTSVLETKKKESNAVADGHNWEQRIRGEIEAPKKWIEAWGPYFSGGAPLDYDLRIKYFEEQLKSIPKSAINPVKYGIDSSIYDRSMEPDFRRKKPFDERVDLSL